MSAGGQRGIDVSGITGIRLQNASDVTNRIKLQGVYNNFGSTIGANAYINETPNAYGSYIQFLTGRKEVGRRDISLSDCSTCLGDPFVDGVPASRSFRS